MGFTKTAKAPMHSTCVGFSIFGYYLRLFCTTSDSLGGISDVRSQNLLQLPAHSRLADLKLNYDKLKDLSVSKKVHTDYKAVFDSIAPSSIQRYEKVALQNGLFEPAKCASSRLPAADCPTRPTHVLHRGFGDGACFNASYLSCTEGSLQRSIASYAFPRGDSLGGREGGQMSSAGLFPGSPWLHRPAQQSAVCAGGRLFGSLCAAQRAGFAGCENVIQPANGRFCPSLNTSVVSVASIDPQFSQLLTNATTVAWHYHIDMAVVQSLIPRWAGPWIVLPIDRTCRHEFQSFHSATTSRPSPVKRFEFVSPTDLFPKPECDVPPESVCTPSYVLRRCQGPAGANCDRSLAAATTEMRDSSVQAFRFTTSDSGYQRAFKQHIQTNVDGDSVPGQQIVVGEWTDDTASSCGEAEHLRGFGGADIDPDMSWTGWNVYSTVTGPDPHYDFGRMLAHVFPHTLAIDSGINLKTDLTAALNAAMDVLVPEASNSASVTITSFNALTIKTTTRMSLGWFLPDANIYLTVKLRLYHHGKRLQVVVTHTHWRWTAGGLGLPWFVADEVTDAAASALDSLKVELADGVLAQLTDALSTDSGLMDASFATFAFFDRDGTVASLLNF